MGEVIIKPWMELDSNTYQDEISSFDYADSSDSHEVTTSADAGDKAFAPGFAGRTLSATFFEKATSSTLYTDLRALKNARTVFTVKHRKSSDALSADNEQTTHPAFVTQLQRQTQANSPNQVTVTLQPTGTPTYQIV